jgi:1,4-dihydroxy-2-naphthoyl-CoA hydrolase
MGSENKHIWLNKDLALEELGSYMPSTMAEHLGMEWVELGPDFLKLRMPVDHRTHQPYGILHGGASCALAETVGSVASHLMIDNDRFICVGLEINANHVRSVKQGFIIATASPLHVGKTTHVWDIKIHDEGGKLVCISRLTVAVLEKK